jgi:drug/metabolite transporter (DMT)-like permease
VSEHRVARQERLTPTVVYATLALLAFAANSILCRLALREATIDPATFSSVRVVSGAAMLLLVMSGTRGYIGSGTVRSWASPVMLFLYAVPFSFAYTRLSAGTGALILFGAVQVTMLVSAARSGETLLPTQWLGVLIAVAGLVYLVLPGLTAPPPSAAALMGIAGASWGIYTLRGRGMANPLAQTTMNFVRAVPLVIIVSIVAAQQIHVSPRGVLLAVVSGALTSGLGYTVWYLALRGLTATRAAVLQLVVPVLAAAGGVVFLMEPISRRLAVSALLVIGGIALTLARRQPIAPLAPIAPIAPIAPSPDTHQPRSRSTSADR